MRYTPCFAAVTVVTVSGLPLCTLISNFRHINKRYTFVVNRTDCNLFDSRAWQNRFIMNRWNGFVMISFYYWHSLIRTLDIESVDILWKRKLPPAYLIVVHLPKGTTCRDGNHGQASATNFYRKSVIMPYMISEYTINYRVNHRVSSFMTGVDGT